MNFESPGFQNMEKRRFFNCCKEFMLKNESKLKKYIENRINIDYIVYVNKALSYRCHSADGNK